MNKQLIFIDDSGDPGLKGNTNSSNLVMAGAVFMKPEVSTAVNKAISEYRKQLGWKDEHEFKFRKAPKPVKIHFLELVSKYDFEIYAVYIDKTKYPKVLHISDREKLYNWTVKELLNTIPLKNAYVKIDGRSSRENKMRVASYIRKEINVGERKIKDFKPQDSVKDNLIQLADMVVGSINRSFQPDKTDSQTYIDIIRDKIIEIRPLDLK